MHQNSPAVNCVARFSAKPPLRSKATQHHLQCYVPLPAIGTNSRPVPQGFKPSEITGSILIHFTCFFFAPWPICSCSLAHTLMTLKQQESHVKVIQIEQKNQLSTLLQRFNLQKTPHPIGPYTLGWPTLPRLFTCLGSKISTIITHFQLLGPPNLHYPLVRMIIDYRIFWESLLAHQKSMKKSFNFMFPYFSIKYQSSPKV